MRKKLPILLLVLIILLQAFVLVAYAASKNDAQSQTAYFCPSDATSKGAGKGFDNFNALKKNLGPAGEGKAWHHIVEQSQIQKSGFSPQQINNTSNVIAVDSATHAKTSGYYNTTKFPFTNGLSVRDWLAGQSFQTQHEFGMQVLRDFGVIK